MNAPQTQTSSAPNSRRKKVLTILSVIVLIGFAWGAYQWFLSQHYESTDNAYVQGNVIQITPQIGGTVTALLADDTDFVKAGQALVKLDPADAKLALDQAEANLAQVVRQIRSLYASNSALAAQVALRETDIERARTEIVRAADDLQRRQSLVGNGAVSKEDLQHAKTQLAAAQNTLATAQAGATAAREQLASNQSMTVGSTIATHPSVMVAATKLKEAYLATQRGVLPAPVDGYVAKRTVQLGQRVSAGTPLLSVIPLNQLWVEANFKEVQLRNIRIGQPVQLTSDQYGKVVQYQGRVSGMGVGTGAAFALLPAQNATGNWIKVVQRIPVRVTLDPKQLADNPLRVGLSMVAIVDVSDQSGKSLADTPRDTAFVHTDVYANVDQKAEELVRKIITTHITAGK